MSAGVGASPLLTHRHTRSHTHLQSLERFLRGWMGIPLLHYHYQSQFLRADPTPPHHTSLFGVFSSLTMSLKHVRLPCIPPKIKVKNKFLMREKKNKTKQNSKTFLGHGFLRRRVRELILATFSQLSRSSQFRELRSVILLLRKRSCGSES